MHNYCVKYFGNFMGGSGYSVATVGGALAISIAGLDVRALPLPGTRIIAGSPVSKITGPADKDGPTILHKIPEMKDVCDGYYTVFEFDRIPYTWMETMHDSKIILTPSKFSKDAIVAGGVPPERVHVCHHPFTQQIRHGPAATYPEVKESFKFLSVFEWVMRKRPDILIQAFSEEFSKDEDVALILKTQIGTSHTIGRDINRWSGGDRRIYWLEAMIPDISLLYRGASAYVSCAAGEGFGCTLAEAMAFGLPTIGSNHGGNLEFMNDKNSWLVECGPWERIGRKEENRIVWIRPYMKWRVPEKEDLKAKLRDVYEEYKDVPRYDYKNQAKLKVAAKVKDTLSLKAVAPQYKKAFDWLGWQ